MWGAPVGAAEAERQLTNDPIAALANAYLLAVGRTPGSPQLNSFGPNMALAAELLQKEVRDTVLQYFELRGQSGGWTGASWPSGRRLFAAAFCRSSGRA